MDLNGSQALCQEAVPPLGLATGSDIYYNTGNVGIGTATPGEALDVAGNIKVTGKIATSSTIAIGSGSGGNVAGYYSIHIGHDAGKNDSGGNNVVMGFQAGAFQSKTNRTSIGSKSKAGNYSVAVGNDSSNGSSTDYSVLVGNKTAQYTTGANNVAVGYEAGLGVTGASTFANTVAVGYQALTALTTGANNTAVGYQSGLVLTTQTHNTYLGHGAGVASTASGQTLIGSASKSNSATSGNNVGVGYLANAGTNAVAVGYRSRSGTYGVSIGWFASEQNSSNGIYIGYNAGRSATGSGNVVMGGRAFYGGGNSGASNVVIGDGAFDGGNQGNQNVVIGADAGNTGTGNVLIGYQAGNAGTLSNKLYIENSNSTTPLIYGEFDNDILRVNGTLQVGDPAGTGYALPAATGTTGQILSVNASGDLAFAAAGGGGGGGIGTADQTLDADRTIDTNGFNLDIELDPTGTADTFTIHDGTHDLFQVDTTTTGTLFSVNDVSGLPLLEVDEDQGVIMPSIKVEDGGLSSAGSYGKGSEVWYQGTSTPTAGDVYYLDSSGNWAATDADAVATSKGMLAVAAGTDSDVNGMVIKGFVYLATDSGGSVGDPVYLHTTTGKLTNDVSGYTTGDVVRIAGYKVATNIVYFNPSNDFIVLA